MKSLKINLIVLAVLILFSCNDSKQLIEVEVPLPEEEVTITTLGDPKDVKEIEGGTFKMIALPYPYNALEPHIDGKTMEIHFSKHHLSYTNKLNRAIAGTPMESMSIEDIFKNIDLENKALRNNAGGYYNHNFYWEIMGPKKGGEPKGALADAITTEFGSFGIFKTQFMDSASRIFGSGWAWLVVDKTGKLNIVTTSNQDNPLMKNVGVVGTPILAVDVWEHAYYLKYQNSRGKYLEGFFKVINWDKVSEKYNATLL